MASNRLMVNPTKTDVLRCSTSQPPPDTALSPAGTTVQLSASVRNLGVLFDADLSLAVHVNQLTARYRVLLAGCNKQLLDKLQHVLNCTARVIFGETVEST